MDLEVERAKIARMVDAVGDPNILSYLRSLNENAAHRLLDSLEQAERALIDLSMLEGWEKD